MENPWILIQKGNYDDALAIFSEQIRISPSSPTYYNRAIAWLLQECYAFAEQDALEIIHLNPNIDHGFIALGICLWCQGKYNDAIEKWEIVLDPKFASINGMVTVPSLLYYASLRLQDGIRLDEATNLLRRFARRKPSKYWPGIIAPYLLGKITEDEFRNIALEGNKPDVLQDRIQCRLDFYRGVHALKANERALFENSFLQSAQHQYGYLEYEFFLARWETSKRFHFH